MKLSIKIKDIMKVFVRRLGRDVAVYGFIFPCLFIFDNQILLNNVVKKLK